MIASNQLRGIEGVFFNLLFIYLFFFNYVLLLKKSTRRSLREKLSGSNEGKDYALIPAQSANPDTNENTSLVKVEKIGDSTPIQDFEAMISRRDSPDWVDKAITDMKNKIFSLVEDSHNGDNYPKAVECINALRKGCILEQVCLLSLYLSLYVF